VFFLAFVTLATLTTEPPKIVSVYRTLEECEAMRTQKNKTWPATGPNSTPSPTSYFCLRAMPDT
jgi:hypothetical protein